MIADFATYNDQQPHRDAGFQFQLRHLFATITLVCVYFALVTYLGKFAATLVLGIPLVPTVVILLRIDNILFGALAHVRRGDDIGFDTDSIPSPIAVDSFGVLVGVPAARVCAGTSLLGRPQHTLAMIRTVVKVVEQLFQLFVRAIGTIALH